MTETLLNTLEFFHSIKSKKIKNGKLLVILDYDYFLQKEDFNILLNKFERLYFIPIEESIKLESYSLLKRKLHKTYSNLTLIYNPEYQKYFGNKIELGFDKDNQIVVKNVFDFCEIYLKKCYVSDNVSILNPSLNNLQYFGITTRIIKKSVDWFVGLSIYLISQPLWLISAIRINLESPGPIFFKQSRIGIRNNEINVIKFRSMQVDAEKLGAQFSKKNDARIFQWGKIMRTTRIDELPQLFNIIKGELSLIGPRPERKVFIEVFKEKIPQYEVRHTVKPGITGYAQIMYPYGAGAKDARHKLMYDLYYIKNWNLALELKIIFKTIITIVNKKGH
ncbi:MAG: sugar transferase [Cytophagaceae bacterium BCCC1]|nr:MAG: sugar transferase [Cytophagaceae bacterium BCCC1]